MSRQSPRDPTNSRSSHVPWSSEPADQRELHRICRDMDELAVELTRISARTKISIYALRVSEVDDRTISIDRLEVHGFLGLQRNPPHVPIVFTLFMLGDEAKGSVRTLTGERFQDASPILDAFCTKPLPVIHVRELERAVLKVVEPVAETPGNCDVVVGHRRQTTLPRDSARSVMQFRTCVRVPSRVLRMQVMTHRSLPIGDRPRAMMYRPGAGETQPGDQKWFDQIAELPQPRRVDRHAPDPTEEGSRVGAIAKAMLDAAGWPADEFVHHSVRVPMPVWGAEYAVDLSPATDQAH